MSITIKEMKDKLLDMCDNTKCEECKIHDECMKDGKSIVDNDDIIDIKRIYNKVFGIKNFTKSDLIPGMILEQKNGCINYYVGCNTMPTNNDGYNDLSEFDENLKFIKYKDANNDFNFNDFNIIKIYNCDTHDPFNKEKWNLIWISDEDINHFKFNIINKYNKSFLYICKWRTNEFIF